MQRKESNRSGSRTPLWQDPRLVAEPSRSFWKGKGSKAEVQPLEEKVVVSRNTRQKGVVQNPQRKLHPPIPVQLLQQMFPQQVLEQIFVKVAMMQTGIHLRMRNIKSHLRYYLEHFQKFFDFEQRLYNELHEIPFRLQCITLADGWGIVVQRHGIYEHPLDLTGNQAALRNSNGTP